MVGVAGGSQPALPPADGCGHGLPPGPAITLSSSAGVLDGDDPNLTTPALSAEYPAWSEWNRAGGQGRRAGRTRVIFGPHVLAAWPAEHRTGDGDDLMAPVPEPSVPGVRRVIRNLRRGQRAERAVREPGRQQVLAHAPADFPPEERDVLLPEPGAAIDLPYARIGVRYVPAGDAAGLGGDWYEAAELPDGRMFLAVGDVSGHGLPAISEMTRLRHALLGLTMTGASPDLLLAWLNALVLNRFDDTTASVVCGYLDPATGLFTWAQAGHPAPVLVRHGAARQLTPPPGVLLGATSRLPYGVASTPLQDGDSLLMFTDGLVECRARDIDEGVARTVEAAAAVRCGDDLEASLDRLVEAIGGRNPEDDTCLLAVHITDSLGGTGRGGSSIS